MWKVVQIKIWYRVTNIRTSLIIVYQVNYTFLFILNIPPLYPFFFHLPSGKGYLQTLLEKLTVLCWLIKCEKKWKTENRPYLGVVFWTNITVCTCKDSNGESALSTIAIHRKKKVFSIFDDSKKRPPPFFELGHLSWATVTPKIRICPPPSWATFCARTSKMSPFWVAHLTE